MIHKDSICLRCEHLRMVSTDETWNHRIVLVECSEEVYNFPLRSMSACPYFKERMKGESNE